MELKLYLRMLQRSWWIVALTALAAVNTALFLAYSATPQYTTSAKYLIAPNETILSNPGDVIRLLDSKTYAPTYAEIWNSSDLFRKTGAVLQLSPVELGLYTRAAVVLPDANVIELTVSGPNPTLAALIANTLGELAMAKANTEVKVASTSILDLARPATKPFSPQPLRDAGLAAVVGLAIGSVLAIGREQLRIPIEALRRRIVTDNESGAYTRAYLERSLDEEMNRHTGGTVALGLVKLTGLEDLLSNMPPVVRERLLHRVTRTLKEELRGSDSVGRWDENCFGVLLPATPATAARRTLERIQQALSQPVELDKGGDRLGLLPHVGVAVVTGDQASATLIHNATTALEKARQQGQSLVMFTEAD
jgi:diguanylate cyclase (GGDEF)-like protein